MVGSLYFETSGFIRWHHIRHNLQIFCLSALSSYNLCIVKTADANVQCRVISCVCRPVICL